jgi:carboxymethylenebutenolidase
MLEYDTEAGAARGYLAPAASGRGPGVLVLHAWWGLTPVFTALADRLAAEGFTAFAPDLYQGRTAGSIPEAEALLEQRDMPRMEAAATAAVRFLRQHPATAPGGLGAIGFSMGAAYAALLSERFPADLKAVVLFYGAAEADFGAARAAYQGHFAESDDWEPLEGVHAMTADMRTAGRTMDLHLYPGAGHWFFEDNRPDSYQPEAARRAWERTLAFLRAHV